MLECDNFVISQGICLCNDRNQVDLGVKTAHNFNIQRLKWVTGWLDKVYASMNTVVDNICTIDLILSLKIGIISLLDILYNWSPWDVVVDEISKPWSVNNCQSQADTILFNVCTDGLYRNSLWADINTRWFSFLGRIEGSVEECVYECGFTQTRFTWFYQFLVGWVNHLWTYQQPLRWNWSPFVHFSGAIG